jgi:hypothetical protein
LQSGTWAEWVAGLATAASLFLGFSILWRDRRKEDRAEATQVVAWFVNRPDGNVELTVTNGASRPVVHAYLWLASVNEDGQRNVGRIFNITPALGPGETISLAMPFHEFHANALYPSYIQFRDSNGLSWRRNVRSGRLRRAKVELRIRQRLRLARSPRKAIAYVRGTYRRW